MVGKQWTRRSVRNLGFTRLSLHYELPRLVRTRNGGVILAQTDLGAFVKKELDVSRPGKIENRLGFLEDCKTSGLFTANSYSAGRSLVSEQAAPAR